MTPYLGILSVVSVMSARESNPNDVNDSRGSKRNLPSWMNSRENENEICGRKSTGDGEDEKSCKGDTPKKSKGQGRGKTDGTTSKQTENSGKSTASSLESKSFSKLLVPVLICFQLMSFMVFVFVFLVY